MSLLSNPIVRNLVKSYLPEITGNLDSVEAGLIEFIEKQQLQEGETHAALFTDTNAGKLYFCLGAFNKKTLVRLIEAKPAKEFVKQLIESALK